MGRAPVGQIFRQCLAGDRSSGSKIARSDAQDIEAALDAAHAAKDAWGRTSVVERAIILNRIADRMEANLEKWRSPKPGTTASRSANRAADLALAIDHFRYFAGVIRGQEGRLAENDQDAFPRHFQEPLGVVGQIIPWKFPLLMAPGRWLRRWRLADASW